jgi:K+/H+ antiporter YhaU regulatory subunit KhtT
MSEEFEIKSFEDLLNVFENTGDFGKYYLGDYSNLQIAQYLRKMRQENKQLTSILTELEKCLTKIAKNGADIEKLTCSNILVYLKELKEKYK